MSEKQLIGREARVDIIGDIDNVPAKIDTGADGSAIWASNIHIDDNNNLRFKLFDEGSPYYTGQEYICSEYSIARVKSASGDVVLKYRTNIPVMIAGKRIKVLFGLCNRSTHNYPILIGRRTLSGKFIVDVTQHESLIQKNTKKKSEKLNKKLLADPKNFHKKFYLKEEAKI